MIFEQGGRTLTPFHFFSGSEVSDHAGSGGVFSWLTIVMGKQFTFGDFSPEF